MKSFGAMTIRLLEFVRLGHHDIANLSFNCKIKKRDGKITL
jgi:hypothetical protein